MRILLSHQTQDAEYGQYWRTVIKSCKSLYNAEKLKSKKMSPKLIRKILKWENIANKFGLKGCEILNSRLFKKLILRSYE